MNKQEKEYTAQVRKEICSKLRDIFGPPEKVEVEELDTIFGIIKALPNKGPIKSLFPDTPHTDAKMEGYHIIRFGLIETPEVSTINEILNCLQHAENEIVKNYTCGKFLTLQEPVVYIIKDKLVATEVIGVVAYDSI